MWEWLKRLFRIGKAEAHSALDKLENPVKMSEQAIRDLKADLDKSLQSLAEVKAIAIRTRRESDTYKQNAIDYETKAMALLKKAQAGTISMEEAERLASEALLRKEENVRLAKTASANQAKYDQMVNNLEGKVRELKSNIAKWENELKTLKARSKVSEATQKINKQLANIDSSSTVSLLERMKEKVEEQEALAESYADMANIEKSVDREIDKALADADKSEVSDQLAALKAKMGLINEAPKSIVIEEAKIIQDKKEDGV